MTFFKTAGLVTGTALLAMVGAGCSGSSPSQSSDGPTTITYWSWDGAPGKEIVDPMIKGFESANPGITVQYTEIPRADYKAKVASALGAGESIDVLNVQPGSWAGEVQDYLSPVSEWSNADELTNAFTPISVDQTKRLFSDGELYGDPLYSTGSTIGIYNAKLLTELGVEPPTTVAEFAAMSKALKAKDPDILSAVVPSGRLVPGRSCTDSRRAVRPGVLQQGPLPEGSLEHPELCLRPERLQEAVRRRGLRQGNARHGLRHGDEHL